MTKEDAKKDTISADDERQENRDHPRFMNPPASLREEKEEEVEEVEEDDFIKTLGMARPFEEDLPDLPII